MELDEYLISIDKKHGKDLGIRKISYVKNPAVIIKGLAFAKQKPTKEIKFSSDDVKMRIVAPAMVPMDIYRFDDESEYSYNIKFTKGDIEILRNDFMKNLNNKTVMNLEHTEEVTPSFIIETWIEGEKFSRAKEEFGIDGVPAGTMMVISQFEDREYYDNIVKNEQFAFSIEGFFGLEEFKFMINKKKEFAMNGQKFYNEGPGAYIELPVGEHIIADKIYTIASGIENEGLENEYKYNYIVSIIPNNSTEMLNRKKENTKMAEMKLPDGEHTIGDKIYVIKDGEVIEVKDVVEAGAAEGDKPEGEKPETEVEAALPTATETPEAEGEKPAETETPATIDEELIMKVLQPELEKIYEMIADLKAKIVNEAPTTETPEADVKMSGVNKMLYSFNELLKANEE